MRTQQQIVIGVSIIILLIISMSIVSIVSDSIVEGQDLSDIYGGYKTKEEYEKSLENKTLEELDREYERLEEMMNREFGSLD